MNWKQENNSNGSDWVVSKLRVNNRSLQGEGSNPRRLIRGEEEANGQYMGDDQSTKTSNSVNAGVFPLEFDSTSELREGRLWDGRPSNYSVLPGQEG